MVKNVKNHFQDKFFTWSNLRFDKIGENLRISSPNVSKNKVKATLKVPNNVKNCHIINCPKNCPRNQKVNKNFMILLELKGPQQLFFSVQEALLAPLRDSKLKNGD